MRCFSELTFQVAMRTVPRYRRLPRARLSAHAHEDHLTLVRLEVDQAGEDDACVEEDTHGGAVAQIALQAAPRIESPA